MRNIKDAMISGELDVIDPTTGIVVYIMSPFLLNHQSAWHNLEAIIDAHTLKLIIYDLMRQPGANLKAHAQDLEELEYYLQELWGFSRDARFHKSWEYPGCTCPQLDNINVYPNRRIINSECPIHGPQ